MDSLSRLYANRRNWTWETSVGNVRIGLERNGQIEYIRIRATTGGYEFATSFSQPESSLLREAKFSTVRKLTNKEDNTKYLVALDRSGNPIVPPPEGDALSDQMDGYLYGRDWKLRFGAELDRPFLVPKTDWFEIPLPETPEELLRRTEMGMRGGKHSTQVTSYGRRYLNITSIYSVIGLAGLGFSSYYTYVIQASDLRYSIIQDWPVLHKRSKKSKTLYELGYETYSAAYQNGFIVGHQEQGERYFFYAYHIKTGNYYPIDLKDALRPSWIGFNSYTSWFWRGDGRRCISLQYDPYSTDPDRELLNSVIVDVTIHEIEFNLDGLDEDENLQGSVLNKFSTRNHPHNRYPVAVDYDLFDGGIRRILVFEHWIGPRYEMRDDYKLSGRDSAMSRSILIYALFCTVSDSGQISEPYYAIPVYHKPWLQVLLPDDLANEGESFPDEWFDEGYAATGGGRYTSEGCIGFDAVHGYSGFAARIAALDLRAEAIALYAQVQHQILPDDYFEGPVTYTYEHNKRYRIWGEESWRQDEWVADSGNPSAPGVNPFSTLVSAAGVITPPSGYVRYEEGHPYFNTYIRGASTRYYYEEILRYMYPGNDTAMLYDGFRINPDKSFALYVHEGADFHVHWRVSRWRAQAIPDAVRPFIHFDHVEYFQRDSEGSPAPVVSTHRELFNAARESVYSHTDLESFCANGFWGN